jgi:hypothetical protein
VWSAFYVHSFLIPFYELIPSPADSPKFSDLECVLFPALIFTINGIYPIIQIQPAAGSLIRVTGKSRPGAAWTITESE